MGQVSKSARFVDGAANLLGFNQAGEFRFPS